MTNANDPHQVGSDRKSRRTGVWVSGVVGCMLLLVVATLLSIDPALWSEGTLNATASHFQTQKQSQPPVTPIEDCDAAESAETDKEKQAGCRVGSLVNALDVFWSTYLPQQGFRYAQPKAVFFDREVSTDCGSIRSTSGTFYCPLNETLYYDINFFKELYRKLDGGKGVTAGRYAVAQNFGHHIQKLTGDLEHAYRQMEEKDKGGKPEKEFYGAQYLELQADCFVGLWSRSLEKQSTAPVLTETITTAKAEEALTSLEPLSLERQKETTPPVNTWEKIHSTPAQRVRWYANGHDKGDFSQCNTLKVRPKL